MMGVVADTHATLWFLDDSSELSPTARTAMLATLAAGGSVFVPSISLVEVVYLVEKGRIAPDSFERITEAITDPSTGFVLAPLELDTAECLRLVPRDAIPDMPDRIIAATALLLGLPLISRDRKITASTIQTVW